MTETRDAMTEVRNVPARTAEAGPGTGEPPTGSARRLKVVGINGSYGSPSKTAALIDLIAQEVARHYETDYERVDVAFLGADLTGALSRDSAGPNAVAALESVEHADVLIAGSPVHQGSYSGLFKHFVDLVDSYALADKPTILAATGGSERHMLMVDQELRPLFAYLQTHTSPTGVYASSGDFAEQAVLNPQVFSRIELTVRDLGPLLAAAVVRSRTHGETRQ